MASVALDFIPPDEPNIVSMRIYESPTKDGTFTLIETVSVGTYPEYLTRYTTDLASSVNYWFQIDFVDDKGAVSNRSIAIQGGTKTLVGEIVERVLQRNAGLDEGVVANVAEAVIEQYFNADPYTVDSATVNYRKREGLTLMTLAFALQLESAGGESTRYTAGLVSEENRSGETNVRDIISLANKWLQISPSRIAQMEEIAIAGATRPVEKDQSRLLLSEFA